MAGYPPTAPMITSASSESRPVDGLPRADRRLTMHLRFGPGATGMSIETEADLTALLGDWAAPARTYAAFHADNRPAATWCGGIER